MVTQERLKQVLYYHPESGDFVWIESGKQAGTIGSHGYLQIAIDRNRYQAHALAWLYVHGAVPEKTIDHKNRNRIDNRISNLRDISASRNSFNRNTNKNNKLGLKNVCWDDSKKQYLVQIYAYQKHKFVGRFKYLQDAIDAAAQAQLAFAADFAWHHG